MIPIGLELGLRVWGWWSSRRPSLRSLPNRELLITIGDSVTQQGYALEIGRYPGTLFPREGVIHYGKSGARIDYAAELLREEADYWKGHPYELLIMIGHNDCRYLQHLAVQVENDPGYRTRPERQWFHKLFLYFHTI